MNNGAGKCEQMRLLAFFAAKYWKIFSAWRKIRHSKYIQKNIQRKERKKKNGNKKTDKRRVAGFRKTERL